MKCVSWNNGWVFTKKENGASHPVTLPHDAMLEEQRGQNESSGSGSAYFSGGSYIYEKKFTPKSDDKAVILQFDGAYRKTVVYCNGEEITRCEYGYSPFFADLSGHIKTDTENVIRVEVDNSKTPNSRWYSGAGIYRPVWLWTGEKTHIKPEGIKVTTLNYSPAEIKVEVDAENLSPKDEIIVEIIYNGEAIAFAVGTEVTLKIDNAKLWSAENPYLYKCRAVIKRDGEIIDAAETEFGIRKIEWSNKGFFINGKETLLKGGCVHHDNGILGACSYKEAEFRKVKILKETGFNAIRSSHYPANPYLLEACDKLGMYVMDEAWDMWYKTKTEFDYALDFSDNYEKDIKAMTGRDYNHPSVVLYSIGNEVTEPSEEKGNILAKKLVEDFHKVDNTRPVTIGFNLVLALMSALGQKSGGAESQPENISSTEFNKTVSQMGKHMCMAACRPEADKVSSPCLDCVDIAGYNYAQTRYEIDGELHPDRILVGSETYPQDIASNWELVKKLPYLIGDFMWTVWDYIGEAGIGAWSYGECCKEFNKPYPWLLADTGAFDITGEATGEVALAEAVFKENEDVRIFVKPVNLSGEEPGRSPWRGTNSIESWSWRGFEGKDAEIEIYTNAPEAELIINGKSLGKKTPENKVAIFNAKYEAGKIEARAYCYCKDNVKSVELNSANGELKLAVTPEKKKAEVGEVIFFDVSVRGENGVRDSANDTEITVEIENGTLLGFGSANPRTEESFLSGRYTSYYGKALGALRADKEGTVKIKAKSKEYGTDEKSIIVKEGK